MVKPPLPRVLPRSSITRIRRDAFLISKPCYYIIHAHVTFRWFPLFLPLESCHSLGIWALQTKQKPDLLADNASCSVYCALTGGCHIVIYNPYRATNVRNVWAKARGWKRRILETPRVWSKTLKRPTWTETSIVCSTPPPVTQPTLQPIVSLWFVIAAVNQLRVNTWACSH